MSQRDDHTKDLERQLEEMAEQLQRLREKVDRQGDDLLTFLDSPRSYAEIKGATGDSDTELSHRLAGLAKAGKIERWDLPRWVRADVPTLEKFRIIMSETPLRQGDVEVLLGRNRGPVSGQITQLQRLEGLIKLGDAKGDPWFLPQRRGALARGTEFDLQPERPVGENPALSDRGDGPNDGGRYQLHRSRRARRTSAPPTPRARK